jgi:CRP-like cAMP-binding protein
MQTNGTMGRVGRSRSIGKTVRSLSFDTQAFLASSGAGRSTVGYQPNEIVYRQGDPASAVFYVRKGKVKIVVTSSNGKEAIVAIVGVGEFSGEGCLIGQQRRLATAIAMSDCALTRVDKDTMLRTLHSEPAFAEMFTSYLLTRNSRVEEDLVDQLFNSSEKRLARALLLLANFGKEGRPEPVLAKISQETLAEMVGTTRSRVSYFMNRFRKLGFISYNGTLEVHSSLLSVVLRD